jgi:phosphoribosyl 1,2-cyclic phosphodiesterase
LNVADVEVHFWGVRGSIPCTDPATARYGGNTSCVEVRFGQRTLILDAGSGLRALGLEMVKSPDPLDIDILFSHFHMDHVLGLPFFAPAYQDTTNLRLWAGNLLPALNLRTTLDRVLSEPFFPDALAAFRCRLELHDFEAGADLAPHADILVRTAPLRHPGGATGYRIELGGSVIAYITDTEHQRGVLDAEVLKLAHNADLMIYDSNYTDEEFAAHVGWGHSTWQEGVRLADVAGVRALALFHHDPSHDDTFLDEVNAAVRVLRPGTIVAREGDTVRL